MSKQCLDIEQMKHLEELGVDTSKASMHYWIITNGEYSQEVGGYVFSEEPSYVSLKLYPYEFMSDAAIRQVEDIPTFTLQDILVLLPKEMTPMPADKIKFRLCIFDGAIFYCFKDGIDDILVQFRIDENGLIDAVYDMLCWLIENGYIETNKQEHGA